MITKSINLVDYMNEYHNLIYDYYGKEYPAYPCIYYRLDYKYSVKDTDLLDAGSYELVGNLSGLRWNKIYMLPIMFTDTIQNIASTFDEYGKRDELTTSFVIPASYDMQPLYNDMVIFPMNLRSGEEAQYPSFIVVGIEKAINSNNSSWKISVKNYHVTETDMDKQINGSYIFIDYFKNIYPENIGQDMLQLSAMYKNNWSIFKQNHVDITSNLMFQTI